MERRKFLGIISLGAVASVIGLLSLPDFDKIVERIIIEDTKKLNIEKGAIERYLEEARRKKAYSRFTFNKREFFRGHYLLDNDLVTLPYRVKYLQYRSEIVGGFLLSTNFFANKMEEKKLIRYTAFYNPYFTPCANPFSNLYYPG